MEFSGPSLHERLNTVRAFSQDATRNYLLGQIHTGMLLVRTARRLYDRKESQARCLKFARNCEQRAQVSLWRIRNQTDLFNQLTAELERLVCEIKALASRST